MQILSHSFQMCQVKCMDQHFKDMKMLTWYCIEVSPNPLCWKHLMHLDGYRYTHSCNRE